MESVKPVTCDNVINLGKLRFSNNCKLYNSSDLTGRHNIHNFHDAFLPENTSKNAQVRSAGLRALPTKIQRGPPGAIS